MISAAEEYLPITPPVPERTGEHWRALGEQCDDYRLQWILAGFTLHLVLRWAIVLP
jgi:hypothetical protein